LIALLRDFSPLVLQLNIVPSSSRQWAKLSVFIQIVLTLLSARKVSMEKSRGTPKGEGGCRAAAPQLPKTEIKKTIL
jgi:hypothetical protein